MGDKAKSRAKAQAALRSVIEETTYGEAFRARPESAIGGGVVGATAAVATSEICWRVWAPEMLGSTEHIISDVAAGVAGGGLGTFLGLYIAKCGLDEMKAQSFHAMLKEAGLSDKRILKVLKNDKYEHPEAVLMTLATRSIAERSAKIKKKGDIQD